MRENPQSVDEANTIYKIRNHLKRYSQEIYSNIIHGATVNVTSIHTYAMSSLMKLNEVKTRVPNEIRDSIEPKLRELTVALRLLREHHLQLKTTTPSTSTSNNNNISNSTFTSKINNQNEATSNYNSDDSIDELNQNRTFKVDYIQHKGRPIAYYSSE